MADDVSKSQKTLALSKRGRKSGSAKKFKATKFDKDLVRLIQSGVTRFSDWCQTLGVDEAQARARVNALVEKGYLAPDAQLIGVYRLGIDGYNKYGSLKIKPAKDAAKVLERTVASSPSLPVSTVAQVPFKPVAPLLSSDEALPKARSGMDLAEMLQKGAPGGRLLKKDGSMCELCRGEFKVSLKEPALAKFAHCVCGAAYHRDCHQSLVDGGAGCVRCGRKLSTVLDQNSQEALKFVKDAFE